MKRYLSLAALSLATALTLSACGTDSGSTTSTDTTSTTAAAPVPSAAAETPSAGASAGTSSDAVSEKHNDADVMFAQMMIPHHQQAVEMSEMMLAEGGISPDITDLATRIRDAQGPEIGTMTSWLDTWGESAEPGGGMAGHAMGSDSGPMGSMEGMMSEDQMSELESAEGSTASRMFLEYMTAHHEGAIDMARTEVDDGENPEAIGLATMIADTQQAEIDEMKELLANL